MASGERGMRPAAADRRWPEWSALPDLPLSSIALRLPTLKDFLSFRGVCRTWRSVGRAIEGDAMAPHPPLLFEDTLRRFYHPAEKRVYRKKAAAVGAYVVGYSHGHLIVAHDRRPWLLNPLTGVENHCFPRAALPFSQALLAYTFTSPGCVLVGYDLYSIQYYRSGEKEWRVVYNPPRDQMDTLLTEYDDVSNVSIVGEKAYVLLIPLRLATFDFTGPPKLTTINPEPLPHQDLGICPDVFLAESKGKLFVFSTTRLDTDGEFVVSRFDSLRCKWVRSEDLGGRAVFVDRYKGSVFVDNCEKWGGSKDCIYFFDWSQRQVLEYKIKDGTFKPFMFLTESLAVDGLTGLWVLPRLS